MLNLSRLGFLSRAFSTSNRSKVFMDIAVEGEPKGRLIFELFDDLTPKTAENFKRLCVGAGTAKTKDVPLHYKGTQFYRIFEGFMCQGGDVINNDGTGGESIYGANFHDENKKVPLDKAGVLAMLSKGPDMNNSNFFITFIDCSFLDDKYVGFGQLVDGHPILNQIEYCGNSAKKGEPKKKVEIINCGEIKATTSTN